MSSESKHQKDEIHELISKGKKQGYLLYAEIDQTFQDEFKTQDDFNTFLSTMDDYGIKILDAKQKKTVYKRKKDGHISLLGLERTTDPVKLYLREMGNISLLTREGEIAIAREIERGEKSVIKALSKTRLVLNEILALEDKIKENSDIIVEMFEFVDEEPGEGKFEERKKQILVKITKIRDLSIDLDTIPALKRNTFKRKNTTSFCRSSINSCSITIYNQR